MLSTLRFTLALCLTLCFAGCAPMSSLQRVEGAPSGPVYAVDPYWPLPLPNQWILGQVSGIATDRNNHIWVLHRPRTLTEDERGAALTPPRSKCCIPAPPVLEFDAAGRLLRAWGGPGAGYDWPKNEHGIYVDPQGNVWLGGNDATDHMLLKFTAEGQFLLQIGSPGKSQGSNATQQLGRPAHMELDASTQELYVADGYQNRRVNVFDANTGAYKRHWGAYGNVPSDAALPAYDPKSPQFANPVHCVRLMRDGTVFVCDRANNRVQVFTKSGQFLREMVFEPNTRGSGSVWDLIASEDAAQKYLLMADGSNNEVRIVVRETGEVLGSFGRSGRHAGDFHWVHNIAIDADGNVYTAEVDNAKRAQKFRKVR